MVDLGDSEGMSILLSRLLNRALGSQGEVNIRQRTLVVKEHLHNAFNKALVLYMAGSCSEGFMMKDSDNDEMLIDNNVCVFYPNQHIPTEYNDKIILFMHKAQNCQPGYVKLQLMLWQTRSFSRMLSNAFVEIEGDVFLSSDIYREEVIRVGRMCGIDSSSHGPSSSGEATKLRRAFDVVHGFPCMSWPKEASGWVRRTRLYGWPSQTLIDMIVEKGCHVVPIGDKCSDDTLLQWRISFATAERRLVHSLNHTQFQVYGLLKILLKNLKDSLQNIFGEEDILCSYFLKTIIFHAVENTPRQFWKESNTFLCFWFCFNVLIVWVKSGYCPQYFIPTNNLFKRHIHGDNQQKILYLLIELHQMKWQCLSVGTYYQPNIIERLLDRRTQVILKQSDSPLELESRHDLALYTCLSRHITVARNVQDRAGLAHAFQSLLSSKSELDDFLVYFNTVEVLSRMGMSNFCSITATTTTTSNNKSKYRRLRESRNLVMPKAMFGTELLYLATFHYQTGNYWKSVQMCRSVLSLVRYYPKDSSLYTKEFCGRGHSLLFKTKQTFTSVLYFGKALKRICLPHLQKELEEHPDGTMGIPPLPYAAFLAFLDYHELGDVKGRDAALRNLIVLKYDEEEGGHMHWIVHTLLGICYQTLGDSHKAIRAYRESLQVDLEWNPAIERIQALKLDERASPAELNNGGDELCV
ncbi:uncharacterized protein LOC132559880 [Ylistrum balloti]|uniref:uncharacterized protein LOC132559880 n=1 Tax=Ylistrum balloti TaxID=509963 RepID=UPI0029059980|nr:uncharacterized protein LOC132559880 [Ylistrum balloti]